MDEFGMEGYGAYWLILELISEKITPEMVNDDDIFLTLSEKKWRKFITFSAKKFRNFIKLCESLKLFQIDTTNNLVKISFYETPDIFDIRASTQYLRPSKSEWDYLRNEAFEYDDFTCQYCGERGGRLECDHIIPVSRGGGHTFDNLITSCFACNRNKFTHTLSEWL